MNVDLPRQFRHAVELGWRPAEHTYLEPDLLLFPRGIKVTALKAPDVLLLIEVADSSLGIDLGVKARIYAGLGVREYWVVDAKSLVTHVHREPGAAGYGTARQAAPSEALVPALMPQLALRIADLGIDED